MKFKQDGWDVQVFTPTADPVRMLNNCLDDGRKIADTDRTLLLVDQFEETFTLCHSESERLAFIEKLLSHTRDPSRKVTVVIALRADFYSHCAQYPSIRQAVAAQQEYIGQMTLEELRRAIEEPARRGGWEFEAGLVEMLLRDVGAYGSSEPEPGALPLLSHALLATWEHRRGRVCTVEGYRASGGVRGAIAKTAEGVFTDQLDQAQQELARNVFLRLTELGEGTEDTRRRAVLKELVRQPEDAARLRAVLDTLAGARLITLGEDSAEVAHEALIREWQRLRDWLNEDREGARLHRHLTEAAHDWERLESDPGSLYRGVRLAQAREWAALHPHALNESERAFLAASIHQEQHEHQEREEQQRRELAAAQDLAETQRQSASRLRIRNRVITTVGCVAIILALLAGMFGIQSNQHAEQSNANFNRAEAQRLALEANRLILSQGSPEQIALLSLRSMQTQHTPEGDAALAAAARLDYPLQLFIHPDRIVMAAAFSPDGRYLLIGGRDNLVKLWDITTGLEARQFTGHTDHVWTVGISPDGKYGLTASSDKTARLWDMGTGLEVRQFMAGTDVWCAAFSPDGKYIATASADGTARLWDASTGEELRQFIGHTESVLDVVFSPDGNYIATAGGDQTARLWDVSTGKELIQFIGHTSGIVDVAFSPDSSSVLTSSADLTARLWDVKTGTELQQFTGHTNIVFAGAFSPDGNIVITTSHDNTARSWDPETGQELQRYTSITVLSGLDISPNGKLLATGSQDGSVRLWSIEPQVDLASFSPNTGVISAVAFSPDGKFVLTGGDDVRLWDAVSGQELREFIGHTDFINYGVAFSPDGKFILTGSMDKTVRLWDAQTGQELRQFIGHTNGVNSVAFSPDGKYIVTASGDETARLWDAVSGQEVRKFSSDSQLYRAAFSPDGKYIISANVAGTAQLWEVSTGKLLREFTTTTTNYMHSVVFSPDGKTILTAGWDGIGQLWDVETGKEVRQFRGHTDLIWTATFSPDGKYIATASADGTVRLWDTHTGKELRRFVGHTAGVENVVFSPDGKYIVTASDDGTAMLWHVDYHTTMEYLCSRLLRDFTEEERAQYGITDDVPTCP